ncbi:LamB/YcsF family protein [Lacunimicrobium album]
MTPPARLGDTMNAMDVSADVGEDFVSGIDAIEDALMPVISSCHVSCGVHSGNEETVDRTLARSMTHRVKIGAHPSYPDREHGGRRSITISPEDLADSLKSQLEWLINRVNTHGTQLSHVKPHGALYNDIAKDATLCRVVVTAIQEFDASLAVYGMAGSVVATTCQELGVRFIAEGFVDRRYEDSARLVPRSEPGAVIEDRHEIETQIRNWVQGLVVDRYDRKHPVAAQSLCLHSDAPDVLINAAILQQVLDQEHVTIAASE